LIHFFLTTATAATAASFAFPSYFPYPYDI
jgi:hypothetical protein